MLCRASDCDVWMMSPVQNGSSTNQVSSVQWEEVGRFIFTSLVWVNHLDIIEVRISKKPIKSALLFNFYIIISICITDVITVIHVISV